MSASYSKVIRTSRWTIVIPIFIGISVGLFYWVLDSTFDTWIYRDGPLSQELLEPDMREFSIRLITTLIISAFTVLSINFRRAKHQLRLFFENVENAGDAVFWKDKDGRILYVNQSACDRMGYSREELLKMSLTDLDPAVSPSELQKLWETVKQQGQKRLKREHRTKSGSLIPVEIIASYVKHNGREYNCSVVRDISAQSKIEEQLRKNREDLALAQRIAGVGSYELNIKTNVSAWSDEMYNIYGVVPGQIDINSDDLWNFIHPDDRELLRETFARDIATKQPHWSEHRIIQALKPGQTDRNVIWVHCRGEYILDDSGDIARIVGTIHNITERKKTELAMKEAIELKDLFTDIMSHDLMNPATVVRLGAEFLARVENDSVKLKMIDQIQKSSQNLINLCENAAKYAKTSSVQHLDFDEYDLNVVLSRVLAEFRSHAAEKRIEFRFEPHGKSMARLNPTINDVFSNLISNAIKYSPEATTIKLGVQTQGDNWVVSIRDQGEGIRDEDKTKVFSRFERVGKKSVKGSGLGLAIARRIVELHGGKIWIEDNPGGGSIFNVELAKWPLGNESQTSCFCTFHPKTVLRDDR